MRAKNWTFVCSAVASAFVACVASAQDCATAPAAVVGANAFDTTNATGTFAMPAATGCALAHSIYKVTFFTFTATAAGSYNFSLCGATWDTRIAILNDCDPVNGVLACNDDSCGLASSTAATLAAGQTCKVVIGGYAAANGGAGTLTVSGGGGGGGGGGGCGSPTVLSHGDN